MPLSTLMDVMPIWMAERNRVGSSPSFTAAAAALSPSSINFCSLALRAVTNAISDIAKRPLRTMRAASMATSMANARTASRAVQGSRLQEAAGAGSENHAVKLH
jgi:L-fucose isomerase-like protein